MRTLKITSGILAVLLLATLGWWLTWTPVPSLYQTDEMPASGRYVEAAAWASDEVLELANELHLPSLSIAVSVGDVRVWAAAYGSMDLSDARPAALDTRYRGGSVSKAVTGFAAARLAEDGRLDMDGSIRALVPAFPEKRWDITPRQLAAHTGGIRHYGGVFSRSLWAEQLSHRHFESVEDGLSLFADDPLLYRPGAGFRYSTHGFTLLGAALESASGMAYPELIRALVWEPTGMVDTRLDDVTRTDTQRAAPYIVVAGRAIRYEGEDPSYKYPGGGILTTPSDLVRLGGAFLGGELIGSEIEDDLYAPVPLADGSSNPQGYAMGWRNALVTDLNGRPDTLALRHHGGKTEGGSSFVVLMPDGRISVAAMTNRTLVDSDAFRLLIIRIAGEFREAALERVETDTASSDY